MPKRFFFWEALPKSGYGKGAEAADPRRARGARAARGDRQIAGRHRPCAASTSPALRLPSASNGSPRAAAAFPLVLEAGIPLLEAVRARLRCGGVFPAACWSARRVVRSGPFAYVMPALSKDGANAAFYSDTFRPDGVTRLKLAALTFGERDGAPFFHCHGRVDRGGSPAASTAGMMMPDETIVAEPFEVSAYGVDGATFLAEPDSETNFKLFGPVASGAACGEDHEPCLRDAAASEPGFSPARWKASAASMASLRAPTAWRRRLDHRRCLHRRPHVVPFATELAVTAGEIAPDANRRLRAGLDIALVDYLGGIAEGGWCAATIRC